MLNKNDIVQLQNQGRDIARVENQIEIFKKGFPFMSLVRPATAGDGIMKPVPEKLDFYTSLYEVKLGEKKVLKFVPASGAATRMFKSLYAFLEKFKAVHEDDEALDQDKGFDSMQNFFTHIREFAFWEDLKKILRQQGVQAEDAIRDKKYRELVEYVIAPKGLNYGNLPKGLIKFHRYGKLSRTAVEEHLVEGSDYACYQDGKVNIHFTVSPEHEKNFRSHVDRMASCYENWMDAHYYISYSQQNPSTDTVAVGHDNQPFKTGNGTILFRPAGHGALLENLGDLDADLIFVKNIDNIVPDRLKETTAYYKKVLGGILLHYQGKIFSYLEMLEKEEILHPALMEEIRIFTEKDLCTEMPGKSRLDAKEYFISKLNRPLRVCGMVKNEGEPGGGPFWAKNRDGSVSLQIVETAQVDMKIEDQKKIVSRSTHFNPVDLVLGIRDRSGKKFDLTKFVDPDTGFISIKSQEGRELKALELPGLWNGSMSDWNTIFVEVPIETFNPVKTVNDLLREEHL